MKFKNIWDAKYAKDQSSRALHTGHRIFPEQYSYNFKEVLPWCVAEKISEGDGRKVFFHPVLIEMQQYDEKNDTQYSTTLMEYLRQFKDMKKTSQNLHIHRNTLSYRLQKIEGIFNIHLEDSNTLLQLYLSEYLKCLS